LKQTMKQENSYKSCKKSVNKEDDEKELRKSEIQYKKLFNYANDALFFGEANEDGTPKCFIDVNDKACKILRYSKEEILKKSPKDICFFQDYKNKFTNYSINNITRKRTTFETTARVKDGSCISIEVSVHVFRLNERMVFLTIARDITERKLAEEKIFRNSKLLEGVLEGITDIIGVCNSDSRVMFYNQAGYDFFKTSHDKINNRKCYEMLYRKERCDNCPIEGIIETKRIIRMEKYIPELDKYIDCCCNPVFDDSGKVIYIINQLRDITERKNLENILKENEERYRQIVNLLPDAIVITVDGKISLANKEAYKYSNRLIGESIHRFIPGFSKILDKRIAQILEDKRVKTVFDYRIVLDDNRVIDVEVSSSYLNYQGKPAILSIMREITKRKKELNSAANMQKQLFKKPFNITNKVKMETLYVPAKTVSGDFFYLNKINEDLIIGIIGDVSGKGITAALSISAFNVLFHEAILTSDQPCEILNNINRKVGNYLGERYVAACCFRFDFKQNEVRIVGAGINQFIYQSSIGKCERKIVKGPFLGMFEDSVFDEQIIRFNSGDRIYFFTDGLDFVFDDDDRNDSILKRLEISSFTRSLKRHLNKMLTDLEGIQDDCTLIAMEIN